MTLRVITGGLQTTVQDLGRDRNQRDGVPVSGAMDRVALRIGNLLVGNEENAAALEAPLIGPALTFETDALIALTGADLDATLDGSTVPAWHPIWIRKGTALRFGRPRAGCRAYVAVAGGIDVPGVFGSRSTYMRARFGGYNGRALKSADTLAFGEMSAQSYRLCSSLESHDQRFVVARWSAGLSLRPPYSDDVVVRMVAGAHLPQLSDAARERLVESTFRVSSSSDRMGYRLEGVELALQTPLELLSEGVAFGTVQLPPGGAPIILMADAQTTGGYPRVGEIASVDLPLIAQLKPGDRLRIRLISLEDAQALYFAREQDITQFRAAIAFRQSRRT